jgi:hypothetical protein
MKEIRFRIPKLLHRAWSFFEDWANVPIGHWRGWSFVRIDALIAFGAVFNFAYGYYFGGWLGAIQVEASYIFVLTMVWFFF